MKWVWLGLLVIGGAALGRFIHGFVGSLRRRWRNDPEFRDATRWLLRHGWKRS
jgi:hypothetical protein